jgi:CRISPR system Cascade subunit CasE
MPERLHLVKVPLRAEKLIAVARGRGLPVREIDEGYLAHVVMRELWQDKAPSPFVVRGGGRDLEVWGYSRSDATTLIDHAAAFGDPSLLEAVGELHAVASKSMPLFVRGRQLGFVLRACPIVRLAGAKNGHRAGAEVDAFLARCFAAGKGTAVSREEVYREWLVKTMSRPAVTGVSVTRAGVAGLSREPLVRQTHEQTRSAHRLERPDVRFEGEMVVEDGDRLLTYLGHGVGRHRAFGFGALMLTPPGTGLPLAQGRC